MAEMNDVYGSVYQNLLDAGCGQEVTESCMAFLKGDRLFDMLPILTKHRSTLLDALHKRQKQIDCLDYLIYKIKKFGNEDSGPEQRI